MSEESSRQQHPETDLLAGFAESTLTRHERESVLSHLAVCERCRQVVFLAHEVEPVPDTHISALRVRPFWRRNWIPLFASASAVVALAVMTFSWYGQFRKRPTPSGEVAKQRTTAPLLVGSKAPEVASPLPGVAALQDGRSAAKRVQADLKAKRAVASTSPSAALDSAGAAGEEVLRRRRESKEYGAERSQSELRVSSPSQKTQSSLVSQSTPSSSAGAGDKVGYSARAMQPAKINRQTSVGFDAPPSSGAVTASQTYRAEGSALRVEPSQAQESRQVHAEGCIEQGVEAGCLIVKDRQSGELYNLLIKGPRPLPGNGIEFTGVPHDGPTSCMQGITLDVITWLNKSSLKCARTEIPNN